MFYCLFSILFSFFLRGRKYNIVFTNSLRGLGWGGYISWCSREFFHKREILVCWEGGCAVGFIGWVLGECVAGYLLGVEVGIQRSMVLFLQKGGV